MTPEALAAVRSSSTVALELGIGCLNDLCRGEGVFVDMRNGNWSAATDVVGPLARRFLAFARKSRRLVLAPPQLPNEPEDDEGWLWEALRLHETHPCRAVITHKELAETYADDTVASIERLNQTSWWEARSPSKQVTRTTADYRRALNLILRHANSLMFIDPFIDPLANNYREFPQLLLAAARNDPLPLIEIHRASWRRVGGQNQVQGVAQWMADFEPWSKILAGAGLKATVFLWERIHDRYLISDLAGITVPYGFDISTNAAETSIWTRLGSNERDRLQKEFHPASDAHRHAGTFEIGSS